MWKSSDIKLLLSLFLIPGLLVGCGLETRNYPPELIQLSQKATESFSNPGQNLEESFKDIQETYKQFQELLEIFLEEIDEVKNGSKNRESVNTNKLNQKLKAIEAKINQYKNNFPTTDAQVLRLFDDINRIVNEIKPITEQLKEGLGKEAIGEVQISRNLVSSPSDQFYGVLGPSTRAVIKESLRENSQQLEIKLTQLPKIIDLVIELASRNKTLSARVAILKTEVRELRNKTNEQIAMSIGTLGLAVVSIFFSLYKLFGQTRTGKKLSSSRSDKKHDTASQINSGLKENVSLLEANQEVDKQLPNFPGRNDNKVDHRSKNISQPEQNKGVKIQQSPVQSKVSTPSAKQVVSSVEKRQDKQTYSLEYPSLPNPQLQEYKGVNIEQNPVQSITPTPTGVPPDSSVEAKLDLQGHSSENHHSSNPQLVSAYNEDARSFSNNGTAVAETKQSIEQRHLSRNQPIIFEKNRRGNYFILKEDVAEYMFPKHNIKINEYNWSTVADLFECQGYRHEYSGFKLIKPARVSAISRGETWQLVERGVLQFY